MLELLAGYEEEPAEEPLLQHFLRWRQLLQNPTTLRGLSEFARASSGSCSGELNAITTSNCVREHRAYIGE